MTPSPEPEPEPEQHDYSFGVKLSNTLNNTYMVVLKLASSQAVTPFAGGTAVIGQWNDLGTLHADDPYVSLKIAVKAYNNQHTSWDDVYYQDATNASNQLLSNINGKVVKITVQSANSVNVTFDE